MQDPLRSGPVSAGFDDELDDTRDVEEDKWQVDNVPISAWLAQKTENFIFTDT